MTEARDRLIRPVDVAAIYERRLRLRSMRRIGILADEPEISTGNPLRFGVTRGRGGFGTLRSGNGRLWDLHRSPAALGRENTPPLVGRGRRGARGRASNMGLPSRYPRTPFRDITAIMRAIDRRRALLGESERLETDRRVPQDQTVPDPSPSDSNPEQAIGRRIALLRESEGQEIDSPAPQYPSILPSDAHLEHDSFKTPMPVPRTKRSLQSVGKVPKILLNITNQENGQSDDLTPQRKLLNSIDKVEKVVMEELNKLKRTPSAKKGEREKRVRTLLSMR